MGPAFHPVSCFNRGRMETLCAAGPVLLGGVMRDAIGLLAERAFLADTGGVEGVDR